MSYTKRQLILGALAEIGLSSYSFDLSADQIEQALGRLDALIASWGARGIRLGYPLPDSPEKSDAYQETGLPDWAWDAVITNLAIRLAPAYGKVVPPETKSSAREAFNSLLARFARPEEIKFDALPAGAGHKGAEAPFLERSADSIDAGPDGGIDFN